MTARNPINSMKDSIMNKHAILLAGALAALSFTFPAAAADDAAKMTMKQADGTHDMAKKQAKADEKSAEAQCGPMSGDAKSHFRARRMMIAL